MSGVEAFAAARGLGPRKRLYAIIPSPRLGGSFQSQAVARVVKLVDTGDLKSPAYCRRTGSIPVPGTTPTDVETRQVQLP